MSSLPSPPDPPSHHNRHVSPATLLPPLLAAALSLVLLITLAVLYRKLSNKRTAPADQTKTPHEFSYSVLRRATSSFSACNRLGQGGFGSVFKGTLPSGQIVAVKVMDSCGSIQGEQEFHNELQLASRIDNADHVVSILGFSSCDELRNRRRKKRKRLLLIYEYMPNGSLQDALLDRKCPEVMNWKKRYAIAIDIAKGIEYLHYSCKPPIVHGDIKPSNVLLDSEFTAKIADFGLARSLSEDEINQTVIECDDEGVHKGKKRDGMDVGDDNQSILEETESVMTEEVIINVDLSPEVAFSPELGGNDASPSEKLEKASVTESCFDMASVDSCTRKGTARKKGESGRDWWWKQDNRGFGSESARIKDYVMEWIGSEIKKDRPKNGLIANATPSSLEEGSMVKPEQKKPKKNRKPREWWKEEFFLEITAKLELEQYVFDEDIGQDERLGITKLPLIDLEVETSKDIELRLFPSLDMLKIKDKKDRGTLTLKVFYHQFTKEEQLAALEEEKLTIEQRQKLKKEGAINSTVDAVGSGVGMVASGVGAGVGMVGSGVGAGVGMVGSGVGAGVGMVGSGVGAGVGLVGSGIGAVGSGISKAGRFMGRTITGHHSASSRRSAPNSENGDAKEL